MEEKVKLNDAENNQKFYKRNSLQTTKNNYDTNKTDVYHIDDILSFVILDLKDYGLENSRGYRYVIVIIDNFSKFGWTAPLKSENAQTKKDSFENILISSKRKPGLIESDRVMEIYNKNFQDFLHENKIKIYSRSSSQCAVFAKRFSRTIKDLLKRPVFEKGDGIWIDVLTTKKGNNVNIEYILLLR